jgi:hypothetical protein
VKKKWYRVRLRGVLSWRGHLKASGATLLINVSIPFTLLAVLEKTSSSENKDSVNTDHTEYGGEDVVDKDVREAANWCGATSHESRSSRTRACWVGHESG